MGFEEIVTLIQLVLSLIGLVFVVFGWIIPYKQSIKSEQRRIEYDLAERKLRWEKELVDEQISKLYGPLSEIIEEQNTLWELIKYQLGRDYIFDKDTIKLSQLSENDRKIWVHFVDTYKIPSQNKMMEILQSNQHLIYKSEKPTCYKSFIEYVLGWELLDNQKRNDVPNYYEYYYRYNYPKEFDCYVRDTLRELQKRQGELVEMQHMPSTVF